MGEVEPAEARGIGGLPLVLRCAEDTCADTSHVAKSACVTTLRLRGWENQKMGVRVSALGHTPGREVGLGDGARARRRSCGEALGFGDRPARRRVGGTRAVRSGYP